MEDEVAPEDSISQASVKTSVSSSHSSHSRSKEQIELDISSLAIKMQSQQRRARLEKEKLDVEKKKLDIDLELEKNNLQEKMDLAINEKESLEASEQNKETLDKDVQKILDDCCTYLGSGRVDLDGKKTCRVYIRPDKNKIEPEKTIITPALKVPRTSTVEKEAKPRLVTTSRRLPETPFVARRLPEIPTKESPIGYSPSPRPEHSDKALEALYRQQVAMIGAMQAPKVELLEFDGDPMAYHAFIRSFEENVEKILVDDGARLARLVQLCKGEAGRAIKCCNLMDPVQGYSRARQLLKQRFGDKHTITELWMKRLNEGGARVNLQEYSDELLDCYESMKALGALAEMDAQRNLLSLITRLPMHLQNKWQDHVFDLKTKEDRRPTLRDVLTFVQRAAAVVSDPVYGSASMKSKRAEKFTTKVAYTATADVQCPVCNDGDHRVSQCEKFLAMGPSDRLDTALRHQVCFMCLTPGHVTRECTDPVKCHVRGCGQRHAAVLHDIDWQRFRQTSKDKRDGRAQAQEAPEGFHVSSNHVMGSKVALPFLSVRVTDPETRMSVKTYALLDSGSNVSLCTEGLLKALGAKGRTEKMSLTTLEKENNETTARVASLKVSSFDGSGEVAIPHVYARPKLRLSSSNLITETEVQRWPHLRDLPLHHAEIEEVTLLIGQDCPEALMPLTVVPGGKGEPYAIRSRLGWTVSGPVSSNAGRDSYASHYISRGKLLEDKVDRFWKIESSGIYEHEKGTSIEDRQVMALWDEKREFTDGHYVLPIPFKRQDRKLYDNLHMAEKRLMSLKRKLSRNEKLHREYAKGMEDLMSQGYAVPVPEQDIARDDGKVWYLPHHPVVNPNKEKVRIVFDCAAEYRGQSLNNEVLQGPDLSNKLIGVLIRFRLYPVAFMADIQAMFHQVRVVREDQDVLRFLWWPEGDLDKNPEKYKMTVHLFGGTWSPSCCTYALRHTAEDHKEGYSAEAVETMLRNFYVDDCLKSVPTVREANELVKELKKLAADGGFNLTKWTSNSSKVINEIPDCDRSKKAQERTLEDLTEDRALGVCWRVREDSLGFQAQRMEQPLTKRGVLSMLSSVYDPLGLASPFVLIARRIVQNLCQEKIGWDDPIPEKERKQWEQWISGLQDMKQISVPRCVQPFPPVQVELHHFSDASEVAYGVVSYLRVIAKDGRIECTLVMAKSRLAPLKRLTLPRLELQAATLAARQNALLRKELGLDLRPPTYWTDSTIVLQYISNTTARYHTFVANRVAEIQNATNIEEWRHVPTRENPADDASRGVSASDLSGSRWVHGPAFLKLPPEQWPSTPVIRPLDEAELEVKKAISFSTQALDHQGPIDKLIDGITNWMQLLRTIACFQLIPEIHRSKIPFKGPLEAEHLQRAEEFLVTYVQRQCYLEEINAINQGRSIPISSPLIRLRPVLSEGKLVIPGRISHAKVPSHVKVPVVLSSRHPAVESLCRYVHEKTAHSGRNYVLAELRQKYWIVGAASLVKRIIRTCVTCRRRDARPCQQKEADLPPDRVASYEPPFTNVGVDYFGPFAVKRGRGREKRYGCLFTCLATRAIHIEAAETMDTDSFINCLYRFIARRGEPQLIRSDNGTNFVGAERELKKELQAWNQDRIHEVLGHRGIRWIFNPPAASHMGGAWERQIRTVRRVLFAIMTEQVPTSEMLMTLLVIAEGIVNNRPLTPISDDPKDLEPLTPNHLLIHRPANIPPGLFSENDMYHRKKWRQVQYLADTFWKRWTREYLSSLVQRTQWHGTHRNVQENDLVLVIANNTPRNSWPVGRIIETYKGQDDLVRSARVRLRDSELVRPITKLCVLEETRD